MKLHQLCLVIMLMGLVFVTAGKASTEVSQFARLPVNNYATTDFEFMTELKTVAEVEKVIIDCQSFINGIMFKEQATDGDWNTAYQSALSEAECEEVTKFVRNSVDGKKNACVELDLLRNTYQLSRKTSDCR
ncbi:MAG: hypothetical protein HOM21_08365 [Halobacteriovoraceae bacterium]|nr:hypothetical protein [Halobacteriovoraceae bacterium]